SKRFCFGFGDFQSRDILFPVEVVEDVRVVVGRYLEGLSCKIATVFDRGTAILLCQFGFELGVLIFGGDDDHVLEILRCRTDQGDSADVDLLDDVRLGGARSHSFLKRIQIDDHQVNCWNFELGCLSQVTLIFSSVEDASKDLWVKGFYSTSKDGRIAREVFYRDDFSALLLD